MPAGFHAFWASFGRGVIFLRWAHPSSKRLLIVMSDASAHITASAAANVKSGAQLSRRNFLLGRRTPVVENGPQCAVILPQCLANQGVVCRTCGEQCEAGAIRFRPRLGGVALPELDTTRCNGCANCLPGCPTQAIALQPVPETAQPGGSAA